MTEIALTVNGVQHTADVEPRLTLADFVREELRLTGTHLGCEHGVCGACTVLMDGQAVRGCLVLAVQADGAEVTTVEGLSGPEGALSPVQEAMRSCHGLQCGFCTPGFVVSITALLEQQADRARSQAPGTQATLTDDQIREGLSGNICRCTGYQGIIAAVRRASEAAR